MVVREHISKAPTTVAQFRKAAEAGFRKANYEHGVKIEIVWTFGPQKCEWPTGLKGFNGFFTASAPGYRTRQNVSASFSHETGLSVG